LSHALSPPTLFFFLWYWGLNSEPIPLAALPVLLCDDFIFKIGSHELFAQAGFKP
jgi:hypothetical protein